MMRPLFWVFPCFLLSLLDCKLFSSMTWYPISVDLEKATFLKHKICCKILIFCSKLCGWWAAFCESHILIQNQFIYYIDSYRFDLKLLNLKPLWCTFWSYMINAERLLNTITELNGAKLGLLICKVFLQTFFFSKHKFLNENF